MRTYIGKRGGICEVWVEENDKCGELPLYLHVRNHGATGFGWGGIGAESAQLALAILIDHCTIDRYLGTPRPNIEKALSLYQRFKFKIVSELPLSGWQLTTVDVDRAVKEILKELRKEEKS